MSDRLTVLTSKSVFTGTGDLPFEGFVAVRGNRIEAVGTKCEVASYLTQADEVVDLGDRTVMPGLIDVHTFYTGWALRTLGSDLSGIADAKEAVSLLRAWTAGGAYDLMREDELGTLEVGKLADICVLDRDVFDLDYRDARDLSVDMTMSDGQIVFDRNKEA